MFEVMDPPGEDEACRICGRALIGDPDDQPRPPLGPMCGECYRAREGDVEIGQRESVESDR